MSSRPRICSSFLLPVAAAALSLVLFAPCASADGITVTIDPTSATIIEGQTLTLNATFTNDSDSPISFIGEGEAAAFVTGDPSDSPNDFGLAYGSCVTGYGAIPGGSPRFPILTTLAPGASCVLSQPVTAVPGSTPENEDAGVYEVLISLEYGNGLMVASSPDVLVTVEDQAPPTVPRAGAFVTASARHRIAHFAAHGYVWSADSPIRWLAEAGQEDQRSRYARRRIWPTVG